MKNGKRTMARVLSIVLSTAILAGLIPPFDMLKASAAAVDTVYAAAYQNAALSGTTLPSQVSVGGVMTDVTWKIGADTFSVPYDTVQITGDAGGTAVTAKVEVIPPASNQLAYFVDSGRVRDSYNIPAADSSYSPLYDAVKALTGSALINQKADQRYVSGTTDWGIDDSVQKFKNSLNGSNKDADGISADPATNPSVWGVGIRCDPNNNNIVYQLKALAAGTYTLTSGFYDWYGGRSREMQPTIDYQDQSGAKKTITLDKLNTQTTQIYSGEFTIPADIDTSVPMTLTYVYTAGEKPILSWFAVANGSIKSSVDSAWKEKASRVYVTLNGNDIKADNVNGLTFKGFGVLSGNSTSALLMDYKSEQPAVYQQMLQVLFGGAHPIMDNIKVEMGNDRNTSTGPEAATKRTADETVNVAREPGFQLAADAKKLNPNIRTGILRWCAPGWVKTNDDIYTWYKETILAVYRTYGYMIDYVNPGVNESGPDFTWTKDYANRVKTDTTGFNDATEQALYNKIKVVISDEAGLGSFGAAMTSATDSSLRDAVTVAGYHYNTDDDSAGNFKKLADTFDKEVWNSEAQATFSNSSYRPNNNVKDPTVAGTGIGGTGGPLEMANTIVKGFVNSRRTNFIYQPAIAAFYDGGQYSAKSLVEAADPWSGFIHYDAGLTMLQHFSWFANLGWENDTNTAGIWRAVPQASATTATGTNPVNGRNGLANYVTLASPDKKNFSTVIVNDSEYTKTYKIQTANMQFAGTPSLGVWETRAADSGKAFNSNYMQHREDVSADASGVYTISIKPYSIVTVTTLDCKNDPAYQQKLPVEGNRTILDTDAAGKGHSTGDTVLYADNFEYAGKTVPVIGAGGTLSGTESFMDSRGGDKGATPLYTHDMNGAFEAYKDPAGGNYFLRQQVDGDTVPVGNAWNYYDPVTAIGDYRWTNYKASVDVSFEDNDLKAGANYATIGARQQNCDAGSNAPYVPYAVKFSFDGTWQLLVNGSSVATGNVAAGTGVQIASFDTSYNAWHNIAVQVAGSKVTAFIDGTAVATYTDSVPRLSGRVTLGSGFYYTRFDNLKVEAVDGYAPYYSEQLDNLEMSDLSSTPKAELTYTGSWDHHNGEGMYVYQRSLSKNTASDAALEYTFTGTGLDIIGNNNGSAKLEATVDGHVVETLASTSTSHTMYQTYMLRGLKNGQHTVKIRVMSGTLAVDSVAVVSGNVKGSVDKTALSNAITTVGNPDQSTFRPETWDTFSNALSAAKEALSATSSYALDQEGANQIAQRLLAARKDLVPNDVDPIKTDIGLQGTVAKTGELPATVSIGGTAYAIDWNSDCADTLSGATVYKKYSFTGVTQQPMADDNLRQSVTATYEVVPERLAYFIDTGAADTSPEFAAAQSSIPSLKNQKADQIYDAASGWGYVNDGITVKGGTDINDKYSTGVYAAGSGATSKPIIYKLKLKAGTYDITTAFHEWWGQTRTMKVTASYVDASSQTQTVTLTNAITISGSSPEASTTGSVTLPVDGEVTVTVSLGGGTQAPVMSWLAVARTDALNMTALTAKLTEAKAADKNHYTANSFSALQSAISSVNAIVNSADSQQADIDTAVTTLQTAIDGLVVAGDKTALNSLITEAAGLNLDLYIDAGKTEFTSALQAAQTVAADGNALQAAVDSAAAALKTAKDNLVLRGDKTALNSLISLAEGLNLDLYEDTGKADFSNALQAAKTTSANANATQADVDSAATALDRAMKALRLKPLPLQLADNNTGVTVQAAPGVLPEQTVLDVQPITSGSAFVLASDALKDVSGKIQLFDISLLLNGAKIQPQSGSVIVSIPIPQGFNRDALALYRVANDGTRTQIPITVEGSCIVFSTDHFSYYAIVDTSVPAGSGSTGSGSTGSGSTPNTGENPTGVLPVVALLFLSGLAIAYLIKFKSTTKKQ